MRTALSLLLAAGIALNGCTLGHTVEEPLPTVDGDTEWWVTLDDGSAFRLRRGYVTNDSLIGSKLHVPRQVDLEQIAKIEERRPFANWAPMGSGLPEKANRRTLRLTTRSGETTVVKNAYADGDSLYWLSDEWQRVSFAKSRVESIEDERFNYWGVGAVVVTLGALTVGMILFADSMKMEIY